VYNKDRGALPEMTLGGSRTLSVRRQSRSGRGNR